MTTTAHNKRRIHGSKEEVTPATAAERFSLKELQPWLYNPPPSSKLPKPERVKPKRKVANYVEIRSWLSANGNATYLEIAIGLGIEPPIVAAAFTRGIPGVGLVATKRNERGNPVKVWGVVEDGRS
jgi:hypothetical protein